MLKLKTLKFQNIGRFVVEQTIDFSTLSGLIQVDAFNANSGGSSGAGKSTIFLAIEYLLGLNSMPLSVLQSRLTKEALWVEGSFDIDGQPITITRSKKGLKIDGLGELTEGSSKLSEERLDKIIGMPRDLLRLIMHKRQKEGGFFLEMSNKDTYILLSNAKGLNEHTKKAEQIDLDLKKLIESELQAKNSLDSAEAGLKSTIEAISAIGEPPKASTFSEKDIEALELSTANAMGYWTAIERTHSLEKAELANKRPNLIVESFDRVRINQIDHELSGLAGKIKDLETKEKSRQQTAKDQVNALKIKLINAKSAVTQSEKAKTEAARIVSELKSIKDNICPTCTQQWITDNIKTKETELLQTFEIQKSLILAGVQAIQETVTLQESVDKASNELTSQPILELELIEINKLSNDLKLELNGLREIEQEYTKTQSVIVKKANDEYVTQLNALSQKQSGELSAAKEIYTKANQELTHVKQDRHAASMSVSKYKDTEDKLQAQKITKELLLDKHSKELIELKDKIEIVSEAKLLVKSFISCSFDDALVSIAERATAILRGIPNMQTATIQLEGMRETKDGKTKEEVTAVLSVDGEQNVPIKSLSGGERSAVDLSIDLAVIEFLELSTGNGCDFFVLDEPFGGMDSVSIEQILELLRSSNLDKKLIIVDHNDVVKQFVQNKIMVTREGDYSTVEVL